MTKRNFPQCILSIIVRTNVLPSYPEQAICHTRPTTNTQRTGRPEYRSFKIKCKTVWFTGKCGLVPVESNPRN